MEIDIGSALEKGARRTFKKNGLIIAGLLFIASIINTVFGSSLIESIGNLESVSGEAAAQIPLALQLPLPLSAILLLAGALVSTVITIAAVRTFVSDETETIPKEFYTRNIGMTILNLIAGGIVFGLAVTIGTIAFIIPGIFLLVSLYFWNIFVIAEDQNFIEGFENSWSATKGNRFELFGLGVIVAIIGFVVGFGSGVINGLLTLASNQAVGTIFQAIPNALITTFSLATAAQAYNQLTE